MTTSLAGDRERERGRERENERETENLPVLLTYERKFYCVNS